jgi:hypothetical protein
LTYSGEFGLVMLESSKGGNMWSEGSKYENEEAVADIENGATIIMGGFAWYRRRNANSVVFRQP